MMFEKYIFITKIKLKQMEFETLTLKLENQQKVINELTAENEQLFQQFNHLMVRNGKLLKRIDDMQQIIDSMHLRIEESQLINDNMLKINDNLRGRNDSVQRVNDNTYAGNDNMRGLIDNIHRRIDELHLRNDLLQQRTSILSGNDNQISGMIDISRKSDIETSRVFDLWKNFPGQQARNAPNLLKQSQMLIHLFENKSLNAAALFQKTGVNGVTGARYVAVLKEFNLIEYKGARKKGQYYITQKGVELIEKSKEEKESHAGLLTDVPSQGFDSRRTQVLSDNPDL
jgi:predicted transcriptional regulator